jgi:hypothetical protein
MAAYWFYRGQTSMWLGAAMADPLALIDRIRGAAN